ncbi:MAG: hypothetical protein LBV04_06455 [Deferribacteraceae bacterium]|jgi:hypothetical protein|nr:hypothetical protein [Deferribacteraceae bacterium]
MKILVFIAALILVFDTQVLASNKARSGFVYVYEVVTAQTSFQTASKLEPAAFLKYNGGEDYIHSLKVLKTYDNKNYDQALRDYELQNGNVRFIPHTPVERNIERRPYYWWR